MASCAILDGSSNAHVGGNMGNEVERDEAGLRTSPLFVLFVAIVMTIAAIFSVDLMRMLIPTPARYEVTCFNSEGKVIHHDTADYYPSVSRWGKVTCVVKGLK